jgi:inorganic triphosphatase YgiF
MGGVLEWEPPFYLSSNSGGLRESIAGMHEVELKLQVPASARAAVDKAVAGRTPARRVRLQAAYADTPGALLAQHRLALRVRREGRDWVQTLKGAGDDTLTRFEHNVRLLALPAGQVPGIDPALHRGTAVGDQLLAVISEGGTDAGPAALAVRYRTDVLRRTRLVRSNGAQVELAFDSGAIEAGAASLPLCELELELVGGEPTVLTELARQWVRHHGLWIDTRSKSERGELLARGTRVAPARGAQAVVLKRPMSAHAAWQTVLRECTAQITANASQIASGEHGDEHVHQLRVGLRRLRSAWQLFEFIPTDPALVESAATLFRGLGMARDRLVVDTAFADELGRALEHIGAEPEPARAKRADASCTELLRSEATQMLLLDLVEASVEPEPAAAADTDPAPMPVVERLARTLKRWHKQAVADAKRFADLDDTQRHRLRKRIKRLRYAVEFSAALFDRKAVRRYLKPLRALQERLGAISDVIVAIDALRGTSERDTRAWFALGWLSARRAALIEQAGAELKGFEKADVFWRER